MPPTLLRPDRRLAVAIAAALGALAVAGGCVGWVRITSAGYIYPADSVPAAPVALVLGKLVYPDGTHRLSCALGWSWPLGCTEPAGCEPSWSRATAAAGPGTTRSLS